MVVHFLKNYFNMLVDQWFPKVEVSILPFQGFGITQKYIKIFLRKIPFCNETKKLF